MNLKKLHNPKIVQKLKEFKEHVPLECLRQHFTDSNHLETQVTAALANLKTHGAQSAAQAWQPLLSCQALQPAQHSRSQQKLAELQAWLRSPVTPDRVISVVAGGTGNGTGPRSGP